MTWDDRGQRGGEKEKPSVPKCLEGVRNFLNSQPAFSSFLRGASRPKSPRDAAEAATTFMLEAEVLVKAKVIGESSESLLLTFSRPTFRWNKVPVTPGQMAS
jgi:hypothetical protein